MGSQTQEQAATEDFKMWKRWGYQSQHGSLRCSPSKNELSSWCAWREGRAEAMTEQNAAAYDPRPFEKKYEHDIALDKASDESRAPITSENPKADVGSLKVCMSCVPTGVLMELSVGMMEGAFKYGRHNYRAHGTKIRSSIYFDATMRHMFDWWEGEDLDPDSGLSHITKAIAGLVVLRDSMMNDKFLDDRPPKLPKNWLADLNEKAKAVVEKYPEKRDVVTELEGE